jgi:hypothetical protein
MGRKGKPKIEVEGLSMSRKAVKYGGRYTPSPGPLVIDVDGFTAGFAIPDARGVRFIAAHPRFDRLDGAFFRWPEQLTRAARTLAAAAP